MSYLRVNINFLLTSRYVQGVREQEGNPDGIVAVQQHMHSVQLHDVDGPRFQ